MWDCTGSLPTSKFSEDSQIIRYQKYHEKLMRPPSCSSSHMAVGSTILVGTFILRVRLDSPPKLTLTGHNKKNNMFIINLTINIYLFIISLN
ncbi:unnamed protein product, partial [Vitis vinifera]|uniref:Uncharacterized protein n=1 Tax=Vitis vinifera TaxID=29760 RepID=E0CRG4_VITVI